MQDNTNTQPPSYRPRSENDARPWLHTDGHRTAGQYDHDETEQTFWDRLTQDTEA